MIDHVSNDRGSVKAMLEGNGDGREHECLDFEKIGIPSSRSFKGKI